MGYISLLPAWIPYFWISFCSSVLLPHFSALGGFLWVCYPAPQHLENLCTVPSKVIEVRLWRVTVGTKLKSRCHRRKFPFSEVLHSAFDGQSYTIKVSFAIVKLLLLPYPWLRHYVSLRSYLIQLRQGTTGYLLSVNEKSRQGGGNSLEGR